MEIINLIKCEFIKHFSVKKIIFIILTLLVSSFLMLKIDDFFNRYRYSNTYPSFYYAEYEEGLKKAEESFNSKKTVINESVLNFFKGIKDYTYIITDEQSGWQKDVFNEIENYFEKKVVLEFLVSNYKDIKLKEELDYISNNNVMHDKYSNIYHNVETLYKRYYEYKLEDIKIELDELNSYSKNLISAVKSNKYYLAILADCPKRLKNAKENNFEDYDIVLEYCKYFEEKKIEDEYDFRAINVKEYTYLQNYLKMIKELKKDTSELDNSLYSLENDEMTMRYLNKDYEVSSNVEKIVSYAYKNKLKHDITYGNDDLEGMGYYKTSKTVMNNGLHLGVVVLLIIVISESGIMAKEHTSGTIKLLLTKPVKRYKVLLSKLLYLVLEMYIVWLIASIIMFFISGFSYGFSDLFTSKLVVSSGTVKEVNYLFWYLKELIICSIPVICFITIMFSFSTLTLSSSFTSSVTSILAFFSMLIWVLIANSKAYFLTFLSYTPLPWLDYWYTQNSSTSYLKAISRTDLSNSYGLIISLLISIIIFLTTVYIYNKKDVKN